jgi:glycerol-3-phosphate cytidylyltransferase-like family protein
MHIDHVLEDAPLKQTKEFLDANGIDIAVRATDGGAEIVDQFHEVPFREGMIRFVPRTESLSTSHINSKVASEYAAELVNPIVQGNKVVDVTSVGLSNTESM